MNLGNTPGTEKRPREFSSEEQDLQPRKKQKFDISSSLGQLKVISSKSEEDFLQDPDNQIAAIQKIFETLQEAMATDSEIRKEVQGFKSSIKIIKCRIESIPSEQHSKTEALSKINQVLSYWKPAHPSGIPPSMLALLDIDPKKMVAKNFWDRFAFLGIRGRSDALTFNEKVANTLDDFQLEWYLEQNPSVATSVGWLYLNNLPNLSSKALAILLKYCPKIAITCCPGIENPRFCDHTLFMEGTELSSGSGTEIRINKSVISHFSSYFKTLFEFEENQGKKSSGVTILSEVDVEATKDCMNAIIGTYKITREKDINRAMALLHTLMFFQVTTLVDTSELTIINILNAIEKDHPDNLEEILCEINKQFSPYFCQEQLCGLSKKLQEMATPLLKQRIHQKISDSSYSNLKVVLLSYIEELHQKHFPCQGLVQLVKMPLGIDETKLFSLRKQDAPLLEKLRLADPQDLNCQLALAIAHKRDIGRGGDKYQKVKTLLENVVAKDSENLKDIACAYLSELLQTETADHKPDSVEAKKILQKTVSSQENFPLSTIALVQLLVEENSRESLKAAYTLLISTAKKYKYPNEIQSVLLFYFRFLFIQKGYHASENSPTIQFHMQETIKESNPLENTSRWLLLSICRMNYRLFSMDTLAKFVNDIKNDTKVEEIMASLEYSPFYRLAQEALKDADL